MKPYNNNSIRKRGAIVKSEDPGLIIGDCVYYNNRHDDRGWRASVVTAIYLSGGASARLLMPGYGYWEVPIEKIYWQSVLKRWEHVQS